MPVKISLNPRQQKVAWAGASLFLLMCTFPPWVYTFGAPVKTVGSIHSEKPAGYGFLFIPPKPEQKAVTFGVKLDFARLFIQWVLLTSFTSIGLILTRTKTRQNEEPIELTDLVEDRTQKPRTAEKGFEKQLTPEEQAKELIKRYYR